MWDDDDDDDDDDDEVLSTLRLWSGSLRRTRGCEEAERAAAERPLNWLSVRVDG